MHKTLLSKTEVAIPSDKTGNYYRIDRKVYIQLTTKKIQQNYRKVDNSRINIENYELYKTANNLKLSNMEPIKHEPAFITLKDHKANFQSGDLSVLRLINPVKSPLGKLAANMLKPIIRQLKETLNIDFLEDSNDAKKWFCDSKGNLGITLDIKDFYESISKEATLQALDWASLHVKIDDCLPNLILQSCIGLLFYQNQWYEKIDNNGQPINFNISMGGFCSAQVADLISLKLAYECKQKLIQNKLPLNSAPAVYRDDLTARTTSSSARIRHQIRETICSTVKSEGFNLLPTEWDSQHEYLDLKLNFKEDKFTPFRKENHKYAYVNKRSNHSKSITKQIPISVTKRALGLTSTISDRQETIKPYFEALKECGYETEVNEIKSKYEKKDYALTPRNSNIDIKKRKARRVIWFNPPASLNYQPFGKTFSYLIKKLFKKGQFDNNGVELYRLFNPKKLKISYATLPNLKRRIQGHLKRNTNTDGEKNTKIAKCNCQNKAICPLDNNCKRENCIYKVTIGVLRGRLGSDDKSWDSIDNLGNCTSLNESFDRRSSEFDWKRAYIGSTINFKSRFYTHKHDIKHGKSTSTLAHYLKDLNNNGHSYRLKWEILKEDLTLFDGRRCGLCDEEKMMIMFYDKLYGGKEELLNKRNEICFNCRHARNSENTIEFWGKWGREYEARLEDDDNNGSVEETAE